MGNSSRKIQDYKVTGKLGGGCFGTVYRTECKKDSTVYAVKEVYRGKSCSAVDTLKREADLHETLPYHRNIVRFIECFKHEYRMYIVLEFCPLGSLNDYVIQHDLPDKTVLYIMFDLARGLQHMHRFKIVHRDVKPDNVLLSPGKFGIPTCKICDFGLARLCNEDGTIGQTQTLDRPASDDGPMMYMAPEITRGTYTTACDIFSLGVLYFVLFSRQITEFKGRKLLEPHINGYPIFAATDSVIESEVRRYRRGQRDRELIISMLKHTPDHRSSIADVIDKLHAIFAQAMVSENKEQTGGCLESNGRI